VKKRIGFGLILVLVLLASAGAFAKDPRVGNPQEGVCDPLRAEGVTKGLYGLCTAFCEKQGWGTACLAHPDVCGPSAMKLLKRYEEKRGPDDPAMPCRVVRLDAPAGLLRRGV